jgi:serine/threonine-protein kinase
MANADDASDILDRLKAHLAGRYAVERELGRGGMATVFLAKDVRHDREVAIKVLHPDLAATIGAERFEREIKLAAKLQHPHILGLFDSGDADGLLYYVMPFVRGESVRDRLDKEGQLPVEDAIQIVLEVADALGYAHSLDIVHRDIKPENILLSNGHALVADFGIARAVTESGREKLTQTGMAVGTPVYMSPEQATGENVGPAADIYSLGCVLYEMLAGEPPFTGKNAMAIMARHAMDMVPSVRIVRPAVPEEVEEAIYAAMEKSVADRPKSAAAFTEIMGMPLGATATRRAMRYTTPRRIPTGAQRALPAKKPRWRSPWVIGAAVVFLAGSAYAGSLVLRTPRKAPVTGAPKRVAVLYFDADSANPTLRDAADRLTESLIRSLGGAVPVVSRNGVAPFRGTKLSFDSVASLLSAGTLVVGDVESAGSRGVRVSTRLLDADGTETGKRTTFYVPSDSLLAAEDSVASEVSRTLREWLGEEIQLRQSQAGTSNMVAWTLFNRAEKSRKEAEHAAATDTNMAHAAALFHEADSLLSMVESMDPKWIEPITLRGEAAYERGRLARNDRIERGKWNDTALVHARHALELDAQNPQAIALRGTITYAQWKLNLLTDPVARQSQLAAAKKDLEDAVAKDGTLSAAYATLSSLYYEEKDVPMALSNARRAYDADNYLSNSEFILNRLFWTSHDLSQFAEARKWCDEGSKRFSRNYLFTSCRLWLLLTDGTTPDIDQAWTLAARIESLAPPNDKGKLGHVARMVVGGVIGRKGKQTASKPLLDSAAKVLVAARADSLSDDPDHELPGYEAVMRTQMGDFKGAIDLLKQYVAANPDHSFRVGGNVHWWWRDLQNLPDFQALTSRAK